MTPAARYAAAIAILDKVLGGAAAEKELITWARANRYAGSGDRHAVRDIVFDALRCKRSYACLGGAQTGRGLVLGGVRAQGIAAETVFSGAGYGPAALTPEESDAGAPPSGAAALDCPDWLEPALRASLGANFAAVLHLMQSRAPVYLRVNLRKTSRVKAAEMLSSQGIDTKPSPLALTALEVTGNPRKVQSSKAYLAGLVELQDAASQAIVADLPLVSGQAVLDYCAGGGGKTLAMAGQAAARFYAHDIASSRMHDLPARAKRAGVKVDILGPQALAKTAPFDLVLADAPCSGSGSWRRAPEAKWALTPERLAELCAIQAEIMDKASGLVAEDGVFAYATCSLLEAENMGQVSGFLARNPGWSLLSSRVLTPLDGGDGFYVAILKRLN